MQANEMTFGVELETSVPSGVPFSVGGYHSGYVIRHRDCGAEYRPLEGWSAQSDSSIAPKSRHQGCEFVSPILSGLDGLRSMYNAVKAIKTVVRADVNSSCGVHVHVGFPRDPDALKRLTHEVAQHEIALFASSGSPRRQYGRFCRGIQSEYSSDISFGSRLDELSCNVSTTRTDRYRILNLAKMMAGRQNTVEFRVFSGTREPDKVLAWVRLCLSLCEKAVNGKRAVKWEAKDKAVVHKSKRKPTGVGFAALKLMMYKLGWVRGRSFVWEGENRIDKCWGQSVADLGEGYPDMIASKQVLKTLARKYDEQLAAASY